MPEEAQVADNTADTGTDVNAAPAQDAGQAQDQQAKEAPVEQPEAKQEEQQAEQKPTGIADEAGKADRDGQGIVDAAKDTAEDGDKDEKADDQPDIEYDLKAPEGVEVFSEEALESFKPLAKELGLSNENAQKLVDFQAKQVVEQEKQIAQQLSAQENEWREAQVNDKNYKANLKLANAGVKLLGEEGYQALRDMHLEWNPTIFNMLVNLGKSVSEGKLNVGGAEPAGKPKTMYPKMAEYKARMGIED